MAVEELNGVQKAAILLIALGPEKSAQIFKHLKEEEPSRGSSRRAASAELPPIRSRSSPTRIVLRSEVS